jgi:hypothetical protein
MKTFFSMLGWVLPMLVLGAAPSSFDRYQVIIDKAPFGTPPAPVKPPEIRPPATGPSWVESYRMTMLMEDNQGRPRIGLMQLKEKKNFTLRPDQDIDGIVLISVNYEEESAVIARNGDEKTIKMQTTALVTATKSRGSIGRPSSSSTRSKYLARKTEHKPPAKPTVMKQSKYTGAELEKHLRAYQMEVLRKGLPPLPVPLTPEMDNQLVGEGVLPPQAGQENLAPPRRAKLLLPR